MQSAYAPGAERYLPAALPYREARSRPKMMEGLPQRQVSTKCYAAVTFFLITCTCHFEPT